MTTTPTLPTLRFKNDGPMRKRLFVADAFAHPAKGHIAMWQECIERYSKEGDTVLDPMSGIGTSLVAALMGRNVICVELEAHFVDPMRRSWEKMRNMPMLGYTMGTATIIQGDARHLGDVLADCIVTSPPWERGLAEQDKWKDSHAEEMAQNYRRNHPNASAPPGNIRPQNTVAAGKGYTSPITASDCCQADCGDIRCPYTPHVGDPGYTRPPVDAIVTSPSYEGSLEGNVESRHHKNKPDSIMNTVTRAGRAVQDLNYAGSTDNIGNLRPAAYWDAMRQVYAECYRVLRPGGIMALVLKGFTRDGKYVDLPGQTEALLLDAGWLKHDEWRRELWSLSFWRILQKRRDPAAFDDRLNFEEVLAFRKPEGDGKGVDAVLTSPPYEASVSDNQEGLNQTSVPGGWKANTVNKHGGYTRPVDAILTSPPYEGSFVADLNASPLNGPIGDASRVKDRRKGGQEHLRKFGTGYTIRGLTGGPCREHLRPS